MKKEKSVIHIKNIFSKKILEDIYHKYLNIKKNKDYRLYYKIFFELETLRDNADIIYKKDEFLETDFKETLDLLINNIKNKWGLLIPLSPYLKLRWEDLESPLIKSNSSLAKLIYSFGVSSDSKLLPVKHRKRRLTRISFRFALWPSGKPKKITVTEKTLEKDRKIVKFLCHLFVTNLHIEYRRVGRFFNRDKATIVKWIDEVKKWSDDEQEAVLCDLTGRKFYPKELFDQKDKKYKQIPFSAIEYKLTKDGLYGNGKRSKHKSLSRVEDENDDN